MDHFPKHRGENKHNWNHHPENIQSSSNWQWNFLQLTTNWHEKPIKTRFNLFSNCKHHQQQEWDTVAHLNRTTSWFFTGNLLLTCVPRFTKNHSGKLRQWQLPPFTTRKFYLRTNCMDFPALLPLVNPGDFRKASVKRNTKWHTKDSVMFCQGEVEWTGTGILPTIAFHQILWWIVAPNSWCLLHSSPNLPYVQML